MVPWAFVINLEAIDPTTLVAAACSFIGAAMACFFGLYGFSANGASTDSVKTSKQSREKVELTIDTSLVSKFAALEENASLAIKHLESGIGRLEESRHEAEISVLRAGDSVKRLSVIQNTLYEWLSKQVAPRLSKSGQVPESVQAINRQLQTELLRLTEQLQFHDVLDQKLNKVASADIGAALRALQTANEHDRNESIASANRLHGARQSGPRGQNSRPKISGSGKPENAGAVELF